MKLYAEGQSYKLYQGSMLDMLSVLQDNSIDAIVTDPPYELNFMNKGWDNSGIAFQKDTWRKCFDVLKSGGYLLAFGGSRTYHRIACAIEDAGFEIRDTIMWLYGSGFPKSMNIGKAIESKLLTGSANTQEFKNLNGTKAASGDWGYSKMALDQGARPSDYSADQHERTVDVDYQTEEGQRWDGWGTALKPSYEPVIIARKPCEGSCVDNVLKYGVGALNIDDCRVGDEERKNQQAGFIRRGRTDEEVFFGKDSNKPEGYCEVVGRFPANTILTYDETDFDEVCGGMPETKGNGNIRHNNNNGKNYNCYSNYNDCDTKGYEDSGSAARYFYCAKASKKDRDEGLDGFEERKCSMMASNANIDANGNFTGLLKGRETARKNTHPTVKPTELMQYLIRLVTPTNGTILDPFNGSGSTGKAAMYENKEKNKNYKYIGIDLSEEYLDISKARIEFVAGKTEKPTELEERQMNIYDLLNGATE